MWFFFFFFFFGNQNKILPSSFCNDFTTVDPTDPLFGSYMTLLFHYSFSTSPLALGFNHRALGFEQASKALHTLSTSPALLLSFFSHFKCFINFTFHTIPPFPFSHFPQPIPIHSSERVSHPLGSQQILARHWHTAVKRDLVLLSLLRHHFQTFHDEVPFVQQQRRTCLFLSFTFALLEFWMWLLGPCRILVNLKII